MTTTAVVQSSSEPTKASTGDGRKAAPVLLWCGLVLVLLARAYRAFVLTFVVVAMIPMLWNWSSYIVSSGSMEPGLSVGDVVVGKPQPADEPIPVGRVMIFDNPDLSSGHDILVHRVVENLGRGMYATAGDANGSNDSAAVPTDSFIARATICVPFVGLPLTWWSTHNLIPLAVWLVITLLAFYFSSRPPCDPRHRRRKAASKARRAAARAGTVLRRTSVPIASAAAVILATVVGLPIAQADAAFSSIARNAANTWKVSTTIAKSVVLSDPGEVVRGTVPLTVTLGNTTSLPYTVRIEYAPAGTTTWSTLCTRISAPYTCDWVTTVYANQGYDLRAVSTSGFSTFTSETIKDVTVDNAAPTVVMQDPGSPLRGTVPVTATASDATSGVARVVIQYAPTGSTAWKDLCTTTKQPYTCQFDTTPVAAGSFSLRAIATDVAGNSTTSAVVANRLVDNSVPSVSLADPGAGLSGTVTLNASASSSAGITSVRIQRAPAGTTTWTDVCSDTSSPYSCSWNTTTVTDGLYDLRAVLLDGAGRTANSATVASRRVDNNALRAYDVQTANGSGTAGRLDTGDTMTFTYTEEAKLSTIASGWNGSATPVTLRIRDGFLLGTDDTVDILRSGVAVNLGSVNLGQDYIGFLLSAQFASTMTASTTTVNGATATRITIVVGAQTSGLSTRTVNTSDTMVWTPSGLVTDLSNRIASTIAASELGASDREF